MAVPAPVMPSEQPPRFEPTSNKTEADEAARCSPADSEESSSKIVERVEASPPHGNMGQRKTDSANKKATSIAITAPVSANTNTNANVNGRRIQPTPPGIGPNCETPPPAMVPDIPNVASPPAPAPAPAEFPSFGEEAMAKYGMPPGYPPYPAPPKASEFRHSPSPLGINTPPPQSYSRGWPYPMAPPEGRGMDDVTSPPMPFPMYPGGYGWAPHGMDPSMGMDAPAYPMHPHYPHPQAWGNPYWRPHFEHMHAPYPMHPPMPMDDGRMHPMPPHPFMDPHHPPHPLAHPHWHGPMPMPPPHPYPHPHPHTGPGCDPAFAAAAAAAAQVGVCLPPPMPDQMPQGPCGPLAPPPVPAWSPEATATATVGPSPPPQFFPAPPVPATAPPMLPTETSMPAPPLPAAPTEEIAPAVEQEIASSEEVADVAPETLSTVITDAVSAVEPPMELEELQVRVVELTKTSAGSRYLQRLLCKGHPQTASFILKEAEMHLVSMMCDQYGNYVCQQLFHACSSVERRRILSRLAPDAFHIACDRRGTHALQTLIGLLSTHEEEMILLHHLHTRVLELSTHANGTHVIQRILVCFSPVALDLIFRPVIASLAEVAQNAYGLCVVKKCISQTRNQVHQRALLEQLTSNALNLTQSAYGNYAVQHSLEVWGGRVCRSVILQLVSRTLQLSIQKYSSNVIEKCIVFAEDDVRGEFIKEMLEDDKIAMLMQSSFGKYVVTKTLETANLTHSAMLRAAIWRNLTTIANQRLRRKWERMLPGEDGKLPEGTTLNIDDDSDDEGDDASYEGVVVHSDEDEDPNACSHGTATTASSARVATDRSESKTAKAKKIKGKKANTA